MKHALVYSPSRSKISGPNPTQPITLKAFLHLASEVYTYPKCKWWTDHNMRINNTTLTPQELIKAKCANIFTPLNRSTPNP